MNRDAYNKIATQWGAARTGFYGREREYLDMLLRGVPKGSVILDLGCSTGRPMAAYTMSKGYRVVGVDQAENLLAQAKTAFPQARWVLSSIEGYGFNHPYSSAIIWDSLFHLARATHGPILRRVVTNLPAAGRFMLTVGGSAHPPFTDVMFGQEFFYDSYPPSETERILNGLGCRILLGEFMNLPTGGRDRGRYAFVAEKA